MSKAQLDDLSKLLSSTIDISCPHPGDMVGPTFTVCGTYNPTLKCPYRVQLRVYYMVSGSAVGLEQLFAPNENPNKFKRTFTLGTVPAQGADILITARLLSSSNVPLSPLVSIGVTFDAATTSDICTGACNAIKAKS